jgi:3',5'-cyclic AMP phosphodiesterase CpdA
MSALFEADVISACMGKSRVRYSGCQMPVTILHLSDIHYGDDFLPWALLHLRGYKKRPTDVLVNGLRDAISALKPDFVVISGDFVNKASKKCFLEAARFLRNLFTDSGINIQSQVLVVPGNHDVGFFGKTPDEKKRLKNYRGFVDELFGDADKQERPFKFLRREDKHRLIFLALDTTLKSAHPRAEGEIGNSQLTWATQVLEEESRVLGKHYPKFAKVAIMHHHCVPIPGDSAAAERDMQLLDTHGIMSLLKAKSFDVVLHGHKHVPHVSKVLREDGGVLTVVGAGTALGPYPDQKGNCGNSFNFLELDFDAQEVNVTRYSTVANESFQIQVGPETFPLFKMPLQGYKTKKVRRIARIANNGDTSVSLERSGIVVLGAERIKTLPVRITAETPGSKIRSFSLRKAQSSTIKWKIEGDQMYDGFTVFPNERTAQDGEISLIYDYTIEHGTVMSIAEMQRRFLNSALTYEESIISVASDVDELEIEIEFPPDYSAQVVVLFEKNGVYLQNEVFQHRFSLTHDEMKNSWRFAMEGPPTQHGIILRWDLPKDWQPKSS